MRLTALFLVFFCLPLSAGDRKPLEEAIRAFGSDELAARQAATRTVRELLEKELAPLIKAMSAEDPEVARRAREVVEGLIPHRGEKETAAPVAVNGNWGGRQIIRLVANNGVQVWVRGQNGVWVAHKQGQKHAQRVNQFGVQGYPCTQPLLRKQLGLAAGRGYVVTKVTPGSVAKKAGLKVHDIILAIDDHPVMQISSLYKRLGELATWPNRAIRIMREGQVLTTRR